MGLIRKFLGAEESEEAEVEYWGTEKVAHFPPIGGAPELVLVDGIARKPYKLSPVRSLIVVPQKCPFCGYDKVIRRGRMTTVRTIYTCGNWRCYAIFVVKERV